MVQSLLLVPLGLLLSQRFTHAQQQHQFAQALASIHTQTGSSKIRGDLTPLAKHRRSLSRIGGKRHNNQEQMCTDQSGVQLQDTTSNQVRGGSNGLKTAKVASINPAAQEAAGNGDFFEDQGFVAGHTEQFGDFFHSAQTTHPVNKQRRHVFNGEGNLVTGNGNFFVDEGFQAGNTEIFGDFFQGSLHSPQATQGTQNERLKIFQENIQDLNPFGQQDGVIQGQTALFGDFFGATGTQDNKVSTATSAVQSTNQNIAAERSTAESTTASAAAVVAETAGNAQSASGTNITEIDDTSATATTEAEPTSKKSASQVGDTSAAGNTAAVASSIVGDSSAYEASIQSEDAADTAPLTQAAGFTDSVAGIGAVFISTGTTTAESTAAEVFSTSNSAEGITGGLSNVQAAADTAQESSFQLPGRQLQVLPIGLGVFGGVSGIALLVVGIVTYERKRYRKQYRDRKNAERFNRPMKEVSV